MINIENWNWAQWFYVAMIIIILLCTAIKHGDYAKPKKISFWEQLASAAGVFAVLYYGGFFK